MAGPDIRAAIAEEGHSHLTGAAYFGAQGGTDRVGNTGPDDGVHAEHPDAHVGDVHGAALATVGTAGLAIQLGHHRRYRHPLGDAVPVAAVGGGNPVVRSQGGTDADRDGLFPDVVVGGAERNAALHQGFDAVLEVPDEYHALVHGQQRRTRECCCDRTACHRAASSVVLANVAIVRNFQAKVTCPASVCKPGRARYRLARSLAVLDWQWQRLAQ